MSAAESTPKMGVKRNFFKIDLIGNTSPKITGMKLPSNRQALKVMFYNMRCVKLTAKESAKIAIRSVQVFWKKARLPVRDEYKNVQKLIKLYEKWKKIRKTVAIKRSIAQKKVVDNFIECLDDLFDIASGNALETIKIDEDKQFLEKQRLKGRTGCMAKINKGTN